MAADLSCVLCSAIGESGPGEIPEGAGVPLCNEHRASINERARKPTPPRAVSGDALEAYERHCTRAALEGRTSGVGLSALAASKPPASNALH